MAEFRSFRQESPEAPAFADSYGYHSRLLSFHTQLQYLSRYGRRYYRHAPPSFHPNH